jgi:hypothetical protein
MSHKRFIRIGVIASILICGLIVGCGPSPEEQAATAAAQTAAAATNTPIPPTVTPTPTLTPTPTPVPYDLSLIVVGEDDAPIVEASAVLVEIDDMQNTDDVGQAFWYDLPGETVSISIAAQGYFPLDITDSIERGINQITVALERDPHGILPSEACAPGEKLLYIEDFQDGEAQGWTEIEYRSQGWDIVPDLEFSDDLVLFKPAQFDGTAGLEGLTFDNTVWRLEFMPIGRPVVWFNLPENGGYQVNDTRIEWSAYSLFLDPTGIKSYRAQQPIPTIGLFDVVWTLGSNAWHQLEISRYKNIFEIWIDGYQFKYVDPHPLPGGMIRFGAGNVGKTLSPDTFIYFNDFVMCELTAPYVPMPTPES